MTQSFIQTGSVIKLKAWQGQTLPPGTTSHAAVLAVFTSYSNKFWLRSKSEEANLIQKATMEGCNAASNNIMTSKKRKRNDTKKDEKETRNLVQCISLLGGTIK